MVKRMLKNKNSFIVIILVLSLAGYFGWRIVVKKSSPEVTYQTAKVERGTLVETVTASGTVSSANNTPIVTLVTGKITKLYVKNGDEVKAGAKIADLELDQSSNQKYIQQLASYQNAVNSLESAKNSLRQ